MADLVIHGLSKSFGEKQVLREFSAVFPHGKISCVSGPSGCGKSTLLRILLGLEQADSGTIEGLPATFSAVFQEHRLFEDFSPIANVTAVLPGKSGRQLQLAEESLSALGLAGSLHQPIRALSGGMKRRVAIVRALLAQGELLVLDEPFTGLDLESKRAAMDFLRQNQRGRTTLLVTHDSFEQDQLAEHSIFMKAPI